MYKCTSGGREAEGGGGGEKKGREEGERRERRREGDLGMSGIEKKKRKAKKGRGEETQRDVGWGNKARLQSAHAQMAHTYLCMPLRPGAHTPWNSQGNKANGK